jgi:hypothetical protein
MPQRNDNPLHRPAFGPFPQALSTFTPNSTLKKLHLTTEALLSSMPVEQQRIYST